MGTTTNRAYPYPEPTDPVAAGADAIRDLAEAVDLDTGWARGHGVSATGFGLSQGWGSGLRQIGGAAIPTFPAAITTNVGVFVACSYTCNGSASQGADLTGDAIRSRFRFTPGADAGISYHRIAHDDQCTITEMFAGSIPARVVGQALEVWVETAKPCNVTGAGIMWLIPQGAI